MQTPKGQYERDDDMYDRQAPGCGLLLLKTRTIPHPPTMGFGLPAAIGAKLAREGKPVVALIGDGGLSMSAVELVTIATEDLSVTIIVI